jgi:heme-degrading monooxygenase HmoA
MVAVMNRIIVAADKAAALERAFAERQRLLVQAPGFRRFEFMRREDGREYLVVTLWDTGAAFRDWVRSDLFKRVHRSDGQRAFGATSVVWVYEVLDTEEHVARPPGRVSAGEH